jgi:hypothetical protein
MRAKAAPLQTLGIHIAVGTKENDERRTD